MRIKRTKSELAQFKKIKAEYIADGYPEYIAEERCWDILFTERAIRGYKPRRKAQA